MSGIEALVVAFGLFIGYWLVAKLLAGKPESDTPEWHDTLHVSPHASVDEIENAYRALMSQYHLAERKSKEITAAYRRAMQARGMNA
jgi:DnaJ-domain-containing protein 1